MTSRIWPNVGDIVIDKRGGTRYKAGKTYAGGPTELVNLTDGKFLTVYLYDDFWLIEPAVIEQASNIVDMVNEPPHYKRGKYEVIDILAEFFPENPLLWQVGKYIMRAGHKEDTVEDLKKAEFYLKREIDRLEAI